MTANMLNSELNLEALAREFAARQRIQIQPALDSQSADALYRCLSEQVPWTIAYTGEAGSATLPVSGLDELGDSERPNFEAALYAQARRGFQFLYNSYMMVTAYKEGRDPDLILHRVLEYLNSPSFIESMRRITGIAGIRKADAQATRYAPGHFLRFHDDTGQDGQRREVAYVLNLTRDWQADWGGLLHFLDEEGNVTETFTPRFNTLALFRVPAPHFVSMVAPYANRNRYAITGWLRSD